MAVQHIETLEQGQEYLLQEMMDCEKIWGQLNSDGYKKGFNSQAEYNDWRVRAGDAYGYKKALVKELITFIEKKWGVRYKNSIELRAIIAERSLEAPDWMQDDVTPELTNGKPAPIESLIPAAPEHLPEIELSAQSQKQLEAILARLREARKAAGLSLQDVADYWGYHQTAIGSWELGKTPITLLNLFRIAAICEADPCWILTGERNISVAALAQVADSLEIGLEALYKLIDKEK